MTVWNISANYVLVPLKFNLNCNIWNPFLKTSPLDLSGQRLGNASLVVFLRFHSFSQVVEWPEFVSLYTTNNSSVKWQSSLTGRGSFRRSWGRGFSPDRCLYSIHIFYIAVRILSSKTNHFGKDSPPKLSTDHYPRTRYHVSRIWCSIYIMSITLIHIVLKATAHVVGCRTINSNFPPILLFWKVRKL